MRVAAELELQAYAAEHADRLVAILRELVSLPSVNSAPAGDEWACQQYVDSFLRGIGWSPVQYLPTDAPGIEEHPLFWPGRDYTRRPNVAARRKGSGGGRSLVLSGHIDTVPVGAAEWKHPPFGARIEGNRLYGRGAADMKCGIATNLFVAEAIAALGLPLAGDLIVESVVDEEFGGVNGTLAGRLMGYTADAAVISEPSLLRICPAQRGGRTVHIAFHAPNGGVLSTQNTSVAEQLRVFLGSVAQFQRQRDRAVRIHPLYEHLEDPVPVTVARIHTAAWGTSEPSNSPNLCQVELFWQAMPGESVAEIDREFFAWFHAMLDAYPEIFHSKPSFEFPIRWLPGSAIETDQPLVNELNKAAVASLGQVPPVQGIEGPCDMYVFHEFGIPAVIWGAQGGNLHQTDEYVEIDSMSKAAKVLLTFVSRWCGEGV
ncbi:MAG: M20/M25/M40 family metallo-hydrolase [Bryobacterales bacterium]|nr:M20/M25/M40 family metallo-hydrolase [Bryobacterales bacterium]